MHPSNAQTHYPTQDVDPGSRDEKRVARTWTEYASRSGARYPSNAGTLNVADCQLKARGIPTGRYGFHSGS